MGFDGFIFFNLMFEVLANILFVSAKLSFVLVIILLVVFRYSLIFLNLFCRIFNFMFDIVRIMTIIFYSE